MELLRISGRAGGPFLGRATGGMFWNGQGSAVLRGRAYRLDQDAGTQANRLLGLRVQAIQNRLMIAPPLIRLSDQLAHPQNMAYSRTPSPETARLQKIFGQDLSHIRLPALSPAEAQVLADILDNPTEEELSDLTRIDGFFGIEAGQTGYQADTAFTPTVCAGLEKGQVSSTGFRGNPGPASGSLAALLWLLYTPPRTIRSQEQPNATPDELKAITGNPFFCQTPEKFPNVIYGGMPASDYAQWFGIDPNRTWGEVRLQVMNARTVMDVFSRYPFPPPIDQYWPQWWYTMRGDIKTIVDTPAPADPEAVRTWFTLSVLANYSGMVDRIQADLKSAAKKQKRKALMAAIGLVIVGLVASFVLPAIIAVIASAIKVAVQTYIDAQKRREAAQKMNDASKLFAADAPAFSLEVDRAAKIIDEQAAAQQAAQTPDPALKDAITEVAAETPVSGAALAVGGGVVAAGALAFLLFR